MGCVYTPHIFIYSSVNGHLGCFHMVAVVNNSAVNIGAHTSFLSFFYIHLFKVIFSFSSAVYPGVEFLFFGEPPYRTVAA